MKLKNLLEESAATLRDLMTQPSPSPERRAEILARRRTVRALIEERRDRIDLEKLTQLD